MAPEVDALEEFRQLCGAVEETEFRDADVDAELRARLGAAALAAASTREARCPRAALVIVDHALLRCRDEGQRASLQKVADRLDQALAAEDDDGNEFFADGRAFDALAAHRLPAASRVRRIRVVHGGLAPVPAARKGEPAVFRRAVSDWPAVERWRRPRYLKRVIGHRTVPVEVGASWLVANARDGARDGAPPLKQQRLMRVADFIDAFVVAPRAAAGDDAAGDDAAGDDASEAPFDAVAVSAVVPVTSALTRAYLAQHRLFDQVPALRADAPGAFEAKSDLYKHFVANGPRAQDGEAPIVNAWFGAAGVTTPLHYDRHPNLLCHVVGRKLVLLWPRDAAIPAHDPPNENTSPVDVEPSVDAEAQSALPGAYAVVLEPGDVLAIPRGVWHYVRSLTPCFSVSVWY
ncbi:hypothetical protein M885DRAFT_489877 [Pelagophyceae sp. CCMP2097]|nr:hypothetical protein M885DRAFT_489877 [Pelagophyceae sp. CCMP2097]